MVLKKQTIWLLTMLTLMVVLSAYYLYNPPVNESYTEEEGQMADEADQTRSEAENLGGMDLTELEDSEWMDVVGDLETDFTVNETSESGQDELLAYRLEKDAERAEQLEYYEELMSSSDSTVQTIAEAKSEYDELHDLAAAEETLEQLIKEEGYTDAVVVANEDRVDVLVSAEESLTSADAVEIIHLVREHLDVPGNQVYVSYQ